MSGHLWSFSGALFLVTVLLVAVLSGSAAHHTCQTVLGGREISASACVDESRTVYLPRLLNRGFVFPTEPPCPVHCGSVQSSDPFRPTGYRLYFADEFNCTQLETHWTVQQQMTAASYSPPQTGTVHVADGRLTVKVPDSDVSFPYLYIVDDAATTYDVPFVDKRIDWVPGEGDFRIAMRIRFNAETPGEHRISIYADGHQPAWSGSLFYVGTDFSDHPLWHGLIVGANRGDTIANMKDQGYASPYTDWLVLTADFSGDTIILSIDGASVITSSLQLARTADLATRPDVLAIGSLALLETPVHWTDIELDWFRVYAPASSSPPVCGIQDAIYEPLPVPTDPISPYSSVLPAGPFQNAPYWAEHFSGLVMPTYWRLVRNPDPTHTWTAVQASTVALLNDNTAIGTPVWAIFDDMLPPDEEALPAARGNPESPLDYVRSRNTAPASWLDGQISPLPPYPRFDWRPNAGNVRFAWRGRQTAHGYGVEISNCGHFPYFTGAMFYSLQDTTSNAGSGQFIFPGCQEQYFWRLERLRDYAVPHESWTVVTADFVNGTAHFYVDGQEVGWWPQSDCSQNTYLQGENATTPDTLFFGNLATASRGAWSTVNIDWFATFEGL